MSEFDKLDLYPVGVGECAGNLSRRKTCPVCKKKFNCFTSTWVYSYQNRYYCSWSCYRASGNDGETRIKRMFGSQEAKKELAAEGVDCTVNVKVDWKATGEKVDEFVTQGMTITEAFKAAGLKPSWNNAVNKALRYMETAGAEIPNLGALHAENSKKHAFVKKKSEPKKEVEPMPEPATLPPMPTDEDPVLTELPEIETPTATITICAASRKAANCLGALNDIIDGYVRLGINGVNCLRDLCDVTEMDDSAFECVKDIWQGNMDIVKMAEMMKMTRNTVFGHCFDWGNLANIMQYEHRNDNEAPVQSYHKCMPDCVHAGNECMAPIQGNCSMYKREDD